MTHISDTFRQRFTRAFESSEFSSYRQLSLQAGCSEPQVQQIIKGKFDGSKAGPGIFTFYRVAKALGRTIDSFLDDDLTPPKADISAFNSPQERDEASFDALMSTHWRGGGMLEAFQNVLECFDLYLPPTDEAFAPKIFRIGSQSLLSLRLETTDLTIAQRELERLRLQVKTETIDFHRKVMKEGIATSNTFLDHKLHSKPVHVRAGYSRLGLKVENRAGKDLVLIACKPIPV